jgi:ribonuclease P protein component
MLPRKQRLTAAQIKRVLKSPRRFSGHVFQCKWFPNRKGFPRWAVVVPAHLYKIAVERNRIRRKFYADAQMIMEKIGEQYPPIDAIYYLRDVPRAGFTGEIEKFISGLGMRR